MQARPFGSVLIAGMALVLACTDPPPGGDAGGSTTGGPASPGPVPTTGSDTPADSGGPESTTGAAGPGGTTSTGSETTASETTAGETTAGESSETTNTNDSSSSTGDTTAGDPDEDRDGHPASEDCDDSNPEVHPGAVERCNGVDDDCDPATVEDGLVTVDGMDNYPAIVEAVAASMPGSEVRVCPGEWQETIKIVHDLSLVAQQGADVTVIDGGGAGPTLSVSAGEVVITGFTLTGGNSVGFGGGLSVTGTDLVTVEDCLIAGNSSTDGAGIYASAGAHLAVANTTIIKNTGGIGGGLAMQGDGMSGSLTVTDSTISENVADEAGAGLVIVGTPSAQISGSFVEDNLSLDGGGLSVINSMVVLENTRVRRNEATGMGGGMILYFGSAVVTVTTSDWGVGPEDNVPEDVAIPGVGTWTDFGVNASFACDPGGCT